MELLYDKLYAGGHVLDVGSGSGYLTACFARAVRQKDGSADGVVVGIEHQPQLVKLALENIKSDDPTIIESGQVMIIGMAGNILYFVGHFILLMPAHRGRRSSGLPRKGTVRRHSCGSSRSRYSP